MKMPIPTDYWDERIIYVWIQGYKMTYTQPVAIIACQKFDELQFLLINFVKMVSYWSDLRASS